MNLNDEAAFQKLHDYIPENLLICLSDLLDKHRGERGKPWALLLYLVERFVENPDFRAPMGVFDSYSRTNQRAGILEKALAAHFGLQTNIKRIHILGTLRKGKKTQNPQIYFGPDLRQRFSGLLKSAAKSATIRHGVEYREDAYLVDEDLLKYFTGAEDARAAFSELLGPLKGERHVLAVHGIPGVGKSTLLKYYALHCNENQIPLAWVSLDSARSVPAVVWAWERQLSRQRLPTQELQALLKRYRGLVDLVERLRPRDGWSQEELAEKVLREKCREDLDLYLAPADPMGSALLAALPADRLTVLAVDTYEQVGTLDPWLCSLARRSTGTLLLVLAGRTSPRWDDLWVGWRRRTWLLELQPLSPGDARLLLERFAAFIGAPTLTEEELATLTRIGRLPLMATTLLRVLSEAPGASLPRIRTQATHEVVARLLDLPLAPAFQAAALVRVLNVDVLETMLDGGGEQAYQEVADWPCVQTREDGGRCVHDLMRDLLADDLKVRSPLRFIELHRRAIAHYEHLLRQSGADVSSAAREHLYHTLLADPDLGVAEFQQAAEALARAHELARLAELLDDVATYEAKLGARECGLWLRYYRGYLARRFKRLPLAGSIIETLLREELSPKLRAYALCEQASHHIIIKSAPCAVAACAEESLACAPSLDFKLLENHEFLAYNHLVKGDIDQAFAQLQRVHEFLEDHPDRHEQARLEGTLKGIYSSLGDWRRMIEAHRKGMGLLEDPTGARAITLAATWAPRWARTGRYAEAQRFALQAVQWAERSGWGRLGPLRDVAVISAMMDRGPSEVERWIQGCLNQHRALDKPEYYLSKDDTWSLSGYAHLLLGDLERAENDLQQARELPRASRGSSRDMWVYLGMLREASGQWQEAVEAYEQALSSLSCYTRCSAQVGSGRALRRLGQVEAALSRESEAELIASEQQYHDHRAAIYLEWGHVAWDSGGWDEAFCRYCETLAHGVSFNRYFLDEILAGRPGGSLLQPLIPRCVQRGKEGARMLLALRDWWLTSSLEIETLWQLEVGKGFVLIEADARQVEPGADQVDVATRLEQAMQGVPGVSP